MSTTPPPEAPPTTPMLPTVDDIDPIEAGKAHLAVAGAFLDILAAVARAEAVCAAVARALDFNTKGAPK
ncbi:MAG: hypothetical protein JOZ69_03890 [Myxococcales bacterium]|nr:hypothetical protein [Myxococcales bacterium]